MSMSHGPDLKNAERPRPFAGRGLSREALALLGPLGPALFVRAAGLAMLAELNDFVRRGVHSLLGALAAVGGCSARRVAHDERADGIRVRPDGFDGFVRDLDDLFVVDFQVKNLQGLDEPTAPMPQRAVFVSGQRHCYSFSRGEWIV